MIWRRIRTRTKYFISYLSIFLITLLSFGALFQVFTGILRKNLYEQNHSAIVQSEQLISNRLEEVLNLLILISNDNMIQSELQKKNPIQRDYIGNALSLVSLQSTLSNYTISNTFIDRIVLYNGEEDFCVTSSSIYLQMQTSLHAESFSDTDFLVDILPDILSKLTELGQFTLISDERRKSSYLMIAKPVSSNHREQYVLIFVNIRKLAPYFSNDSLDGNFYVLDEGGQILFSMEAFGSGEIQPVNLQQNDSFRYQKREYTVARTKSNLNGFTYVSILPSEQVLGDIAVTERSAFLFLILAFLLVFIASALLSNLNYRPIRNLMQSINVGIEDIYSTDEFALIQEHFSGILQRSQEYQASMSEYLNRSFFTELLNGNFRETEDLQNFLQSFPISVPAPELPQQYLILLGKLDFPGSTDTHENLNAYRRFQGMLEVLAREYLPDTMAVVETSYNHSAILLNLLEMTQESAAQAALALSRRLSAEENVQICFSMSDLVRQLTDLPQAYANAISAMDHAAIVEGASLIRYSDAKVHGMNQVYFPPSLQLKLTNLVTSSDCEGIRQLLESLYQKNTSDNHLSEVSLRLLYFSLCTCLVDLTGRLEEVPPDLANSINGCLDVSGNYRENLAVLKDYFLEIAPLFLQQKGALQDSISRGILQFVDDHRFSHDLCLPVIADEFQFSEPYISTLIKERTGMSFINYLTTRRIEEALRLLRETDLSINEIADRVGYNSTSSFRKAFKKITGQNPSSYQMEGSQNGG